MVRALRDGSKTQTRRVVKPQPTHFNPVGVPRRVVPTGGPSDVIRCPYGQPGDRLAVRETFYAWGRWETRYSAKKGRDEWHFVDMTLECGRSYAYDTDEDTPMIVTRRSTVVPLWWRRPAIFMPRAASRITLEITSVRVERLQDISEADAKAEGVALKNSPAAFLTSYVRGFRDLWESINGSSSWTANPWVWVIEFRRLP
jgi:hypothetical protein